MRNVCVPSLVLRWLLVPIRTAQAGEVDEIPDSFGWFDLGDFVGTLSDGDIDSEDPAVVNMNWGNTPSLPAAPGMAAVPEPGMFTLLLITLAIGGFVAMLKSKKRTLMRLSVFLMAAGLLCAFGAPSQAGTMNYEIFINGQDPGVEPIEPGDFGIMPGEWFTVSIMVNVTDNYLPISEVLAVDPDGGALQCAINLVDSTGIGPRPPTDPDHPALDETALAGKEEFVFPPGVYSGKWDSDTPMPNHTKGELNLNPDVYQDVAYVTGGDAWSAYNLYGAGEGVFTEVIYGDFVWDGSGATLSVEPYSDRSQLIFGLQEGGDPHDFNSYGGIYPTEIAGDTVNFLIPEPGSLLLLLSGAVCLLGYLEVRRRRR